MASPNSPYPKRSGVPGWAWALTACACAPIVAVALLSLLLRPVISTWRSRQQEFARASTCLSTISQISTGMRIYAQDYDDRLPQSASWGEATIPYSQSNQAQQGANGYLACPSVNGAPYSGYGYAYNSTLSGKLYSKISNPAGKGVVYDSASLQPNASDPVTSLPSPPRHKQGQRRNSPGTAARANIMGYLDGHAAAVDEKGRHLPNFILETP